MWIKPEIIMFNKTRHIVILYKYFSLEENFWKQQQKEMLHAIVILEGSIVPIYPCLLCLVDVVALHLKVPSWVLQVCT